MANDVILFGALAAELDELLKGGRITKIYQPSENEVIFYVKNKTEKALIISSNPNYARCHLTDTHAENPVSAPSFCMLLRKYIGGTRIEKVELFNYDRVIRFTLCGNSELRDKTKHYLFFECFGRYANIILTDESLTVLDAIKRIGAGTSERVVFPGLEYPVQAHGKTPLFDIAKVKEILNNVSIATEISELISGTGKSTAIEIFAAEDKYKRLSELINCYHSNSFVPTIYTQGQKSELVPCRYFTLDGDTKTFVTLNDALNDFYSAKASVDKKHSDLAEHLKLAKNLKSRFEKRIESADFVIDNIADNEQNRLSGEAILCNIYKLNKGDSTFTTYDYTTEKEITVTLDPLKSPKQNSEAYFKKYKKGKKAYEFAIKQKEESLVQLEYLNAITSSLNTSATTREFEEILAELQLLSGKKPQNNGKKGKKQTPSAIYSETFDGFRIYIGKNNLQNDKLTFEIANGGDIWLHVKGFHGSHVIIATENREVPLAVIKKAAELAAAYSEAKSSSKVEVDYTYRKFVRRHGQFPGLVNYINYKTIIV